MCTYYSRVSSRCDFIITTNYKSSFCDHALRSPETLYLHNFSFFGDFNTDDNLRRLDA